MAAVLRPLDLAACPNRLTHGLGHGGVVAGGKCKHRTTELGLYRASVPVHEPAETFVKLLDIKRLRRGESPGAASAPKRLEGGVRIPLELPAHAGDPGRWSVATETVETLDANQAPERAPLPLARALKQPQNPKRMANGDGIFRPIAHPLRATVNEAKIDKARIHVRQMVEDGAPNAGVEAPAMDEDKVHGWGRAYPSALCRGACSPRISSKASISAMLCAAVKASLSLAVPAGTVGGLIAAAKKPAWRSLLLKLSAA